MFLYQIFVLSFLAVVTCAYVPKHNFGKSKNGGIIHETIVRRELLYDRFKRETLRRSKRQSTSLQDALQNLQNVQQQQSQGQRRPGQNGQFGGNGQGFSSQGFSNGQGSGFSNGLDSGSTGPGGFSQGGFGSNQGGSGGNQGQGGQPWTTVRNPLNVIINENTVPEAECIRRCQAVNNYNPVCGDDSITYSNQQKLACAQNCGRQVSFVYNGSCVTTTTPASARPGSFN